MRHRIFFFGLMITSFTATCLGQTESALDRAEFQRLHRLLKPGQETWKTIPWQSDLVAAQNRAARENKPIFIWSMDGHPLGCV